MGRFIELKNGMKFMIISEYIIDGQKYLYLASVSEDIKYVFVREISEDILQPVEDEKTLKELIKLSVNDVQQKLKDLKQDN